jgi:hypothetical protein
VVNRVLDKAALTPADIVCDLAGDLPTRQRLDLRHAGHRHSAHRTTRLLDHVRGADASTLFVDSQTVHRAAP